MIKADTKRGLVFVLTVKVKNWLFKNKWCLSYIRNNTKDFQCFGQESFLNNPQKQQVSLITQTHQNQRIHVLKHLSQLIQRISLTKLLDKESVSLSVQTKLCVIIFAEKIVKRFSSAKASLLHCFQQNVIAYLILCILYKTVQVFD